MGLRIFKDIAQLSDQLQTCFYSPLWCQETAGHSHNKGIGKELNMNALGTTLFTVFCNVASYV